MIYIIFSLQKELKQIPINHLEAFLAGGKKINNKAFQSNAAFARTLS